MFRMLVAIDESEQAQRVLDKVVEVAAAMPSADIHLVNVQHEPVVYGEIALYLSAERARELVLQAGQRIVDAATDRLRQQGVAVASEVLLGEAAAAIAERGEKLGCNLIVMGTRGMGSVANLILGSVTTKVVHLTKIPILLVH